MSKFDKNIPYNDLPLLPPNADVETKEILRKMISAGRALAQLNGTLKNLPNPTLFLDTIYLQEAKASSEVENIITTNLCISIVQCIKQDTASIRVTPGTTLSNTIG